MALTSRNSCDLTLSWTLANSMTCMQCGQTVDASILIASDALHNHATHGIALLAAHKIDGDDARAFGCQIHQLISTSVRHVCTPYAWANKSNECMYADDDCTS